MNIYYRERRGSIPKDAEFPCLVLGGDSWNDYGYQTLFHALWYWSRTEYIELGDTKILQRGNAATELKRHFHELSNQYCSLGHSFSYYEKIHELGRKTGDPLLLALRDIVAHPHFAQAFQRPQECLSAASGSAKGSLAIFVYVGLCPLSYPRYVIFLSENLSNKRSSGLASTSSRATWA